MDRIPDIVDLVLWFLGGLSILSWTVMIVKVTVFLKNEKQNLKVLSQVSNSTNLIQLQQIAQSGNGTYASMIHTLSIELKSLAEGALDLDAKDKREMLFHAIRQQVHIEKTKLENGLAILASVGSTSPFIGLFGTVWGIMHALKNITTSGAAGLDVVAGPIGEALIATAMGIAAAIPAVLAYNYFLRKVHLSVTSMEHFADRLMHLAIRSGF